MADLIWFIGVEKSWAIVDSVMLNHGVCGYFRFRDDMFFVVEGTDSRYDAYLQGIISRAGSLGYEVKVEFI